MAVRILDKSKAVKKNADKLLKDSKLLDILSNFGKVEVTGSYALDLMLTGDIDIHVFGKFDRKKALEALNYLVEKTNFTGYMFFDWVSFHNPNFPTGYYLGLKQKVEGYEKQWKIDIWLIEKARKESIDCMELAQNCTPEERITILILKEWRDANDPSLSSTVIYDAVLNKGIKTKEDFKKLLD